MSTHIYISTQSKEQEMKKPNNQKLKEKMLQDLKRKHFIEKQQQLEKLKDKVRVLEEELKSYIT